MKLQILFAKLGTAGEFTVDSNPQAAEMLKSARARAKVSKPLQILGKKNSF